MWKLISSLVKNNSTSPGTRRRGSLRSAQPSQDFLLGRAGALAGLPGTPPCGGRGWRRWRPGPRRRPGQPAGRRARPVGQGAELGLGGRRAAGGAGGSGSSRGPSARGSPSAAAAAPAWASAARPARGPALRGRAVPASSRGFPRRAAQPRPRGDSLGPRVGRGGRFVSRPGAPGRTELHAGAWRQRCPERREAVSVGGERGCPQRLSAGICNSQ